MGLPASEFFSLPVSAMMIKHGFRGSAWEVILLEMSFSRFWTVTKGNSASRMRSGESTVSA